MRVLVVTFVILCLANSCRMTAESHRLGLLDAVVVVNEFSVFRVNIVYGVRGQLPVVTVPEAAATAKFWDNLTYDDLLSLFSEVEGYSMNFSSGFYTLRRP